MSERNTERVSGKEGNEKERLKEQSEDEFYDNFPLIRVKMRKKNSLTFSILLFLYFFTFFHFSFFDVCRKSSSDS